MEEVNAIQAMMDLSINVELVDPSSRVLKSVISGVPIDLDPDILVKTN